MRPSAKSSPPTWSRAVLIIAEQYYDDLLDTMPEHHHRHFLECIKTNNASLKSTLERSLEKGANSHDYETKEYEPVSCSNIRWATKGEEDGPYVPHRTLNDQPC
jgi:hypothetical protein